MLKQYSCVKCQFLKFKIFLNNEEENISFRRFPLNGIDSLSLEGWKE